jgi:uncharacterized protein (DUF2141 family)
MLQRIERAVAERLMMVIAMMMWTALACARPAAEAPGAPAPQASNPSSADSAAPAAPAEDGRGEVAVEVTGMRNDDGQLLVALFRSDDGFPDDRDQAHDSVALQSRDGRARHVFEGVPPGPFAVAVLHDENENFEMDTNLFGIPQEGYGASRNPRRRFGPPRFSDAVLTLPPGERVLVRIEVYYP